jgi:predicted small secreted protein
VERRPGSNESKKDDMKRLILAIVVGTVLMTWVSGCRTAHGFGEDVQNTGNAIQKKTD